MDPKAANLAIMFADISGSTQLYEVLGDVTGRHTVSECLTVMTNVIQQHQGVVIKTIGDEIMCTFPSAEDAALAACEMNRMLDNDITGQIAKSDSLSIRVGMHYGPTLLEGGDVFGDAVNVAARMASLAKAEQIITTQSTVALLSPEMRLNARLIDRAQVKGKRETIDIFELTWEQEGVTVMNTDVVDQGQGSAVMRLVYGDTEAILNEKQSSLVLGRSHQCDMAVDESLASRKHVKIECRRGKFFIIDQSINGTYILPQDGTEIFIRREEETLTGIGQISIGRAFSKAPQHIISYVIEES